jgi:hypothetical protein
MRKKRDDLTAAPLFILLLEQHAISGSVRRVIILAGRAFLFFHLAMHAVRHGEGRHVAVRAHDLHQLGGGFLAEELLGVSHGDAGAVSAEAALAVAENALIRREDSEGLGLSRGGEDSEENSSK